MFKVVGQQDKARAGILQTKHCIIHTPYWMPVATKASVKTLSAEDLSTLGPPLLMCNTYHLMLQPGPEVIEKLGGLHKFMSWPKALMTDSGGFQVMSLGYETKKGKLGFFPSESNELELPSKVKITENGVKFNSIHGPVMLTPESSIGIQEKLGADMILAFDECTHPQAGREYTKNSMERTNRWAERSLAAHKRKDQALFGIIQGGAYKDLRKESAEAISSMGFKGIAIGGSLGNTKKDMHKVLEWTMDELPDDKARHMLGIGTVEDCFEAVERGIDLFDCVGPTRIGRSGYAYISPKAGGTKKNKFRFNITRAAFRTDTEPIDPGCGCLTCKTYSRAYLHHLFKAKEYLAYRALSVHNIHFMLGLMEDMRQAIMHGEFGKMKKAWLGRG